MTLQFNIPNLIKFNVLIRDGNNFNLDVNNLLQSEPDLFEELFSNPESFITNLKSRLIELKYSDIFFLINFPKLSLIPISHLRSNNINRLVFINGILKRAYQITSKIDFIDYECHACGTILKVAQIKNSISEPRKCSCGKTGQFSFLKEHYINIQEMEIEENIDDVGSRQPQKIRLYLKNELTDPDFNTFQVGNKVEVAGILKKLPTYLIGKDKEKIVIEYMLEVVYIRSIESIESDLKISDEDMQQIKEIASNNPLEYLANNLAPNIEGLEDVKKASVLFLAKGTTKYSKSGTRKRGDLHLLVTGDASVAKSALLQNIQKRSLNCRLVDGKSSSRTGIVYAVEKDSSERWVLSAGDLVLANKGYMLLDEADKISDEDKMCLHGPMESGNVIVSRTVHASLNANTSVFACANPKLGVFSLYSPILTQLDFTPTLLSRFDLIFILKDIPNRERDKKIADKIMSSYIEDVSPDMPINLFKKYIAYCSQIEPELTKDMAEYLTEQYLNLRQNCLKTNDSTGFPIATRHLEGLIRLSTASAKVRLSKTIEKCDADIAINLFKSSLKNFGIDEETGKFDLQKMSSAVKVGRVDRYFELLSIIKELSKSSSEIPEELIFEKSIEKGISEFEVRKLIEVLHKNIEIFSPRTGYYKLNPSRT